MKCLLSPSSSFFFFSFFFFSLSIRLHFTLLHFIMCGTYLNYTNPFIPYHITSPDTMNKPPLILLPCNFIFHFHFDFNLLLSTSFHPIFNPGQVQVRSCQVLYLSESGTNHTTPHHTTPCVNDYPLHSIEIRLIV